MTTITLGGLRPTSSHRPDQAGFALGSVLVHARDAWRLWLAARTMAALDDDALRDIGVARAEIHHAVRTGRRSR